MDLVGSAIHSMKRPIWNTYSSAQNQYLRKLFICLSESTAPSFLIPVPVEEAISIVCVYRVTTSLASGTERFDSFRYVAQVGKNVVWVLGSVASFGTNISGKSINE